MTEISDETARAMVEAYEHSTDRLGFSPNAKAEAMKAAAKVLVPGWLPISEDTPRAKWLITARLGEGTSNLSMTPDGDEWCFQDGSTTITHGTRLAPTHYMPLPDPPPTETK